MERGERNRYIVRTTDIAETVEMPA